MSPSDEHFLKVALSLATTANDLDEVPVGAVITLDERIISTGFNLRDRTGVSTAHAEIIAIEKASRYLKSWRLSKCKLYVTLEPCLMCAGALYQARISEVIYGCRDPKGGALGSLYEINRDTRLNHRFTCKSGLLEAESASILKNFFARRRAENSSKNHP